MRHSIFLILPMRPVADQFGREAEAGRHLGALLAAGLEHAFGVRDGLLHRQGFLDRQVSGFSQ